MAQPTNCVAPAGGVSRPSAQLIGIGMPNGTGPMPSCMPIDRKIGVPMRMVAAMSRNGDILEFMKVVDAACLVGKQAMPHSPYFGPGSRATLG